MLANTSERFRRILEKRGEVRQSAAGSGTFAAVCGKIRTDAKMRHGQYLPVTVGPDFPNWESTTGLASDLPP